MNSLSQLSLLAEDPAAVTPGGGSGPLLMMVVMFALMYFLIIRPQRRQRKEHEERTKALRSGDKIITSGGIYGLITNVKVGTVIVKIAENVRIEVDKASVATVLSKSDEPEETSVESADNPTENA